MNNFEIIHKILQFLENAMECETPDWKCIKHEGLKINDVHWANIMYMLFAAGLIDIKAIDNFDELNGDIFTRPRITLKGLEYLVTSPLMNK